MGRDGKGVKRKRKVIGSREEEMGRPGAEVAGCIGGIWWRRER